jgi:hypothetical protein
MGKEKRIRRHNGKVLFSKRSFLLFLSVFLAAPLACASVAHSFDVSYSTRQGSRVALSFPEKIFPPFFT